MLKLANILYYGNNELRQPKFYRVSQTLNKINGKSSLRARKKLEDKHNQERKRKEDEYKLKYGL